MPCKENRNSYRLHSGGQVQASRALTVRYWNGCRLLQAERRIGCSFVKPIRKILLLLILPCVILLTGFYIGQRAIIFPAPAFELPNPLPAGVEKIALTSGYGLLLAPRAKPGSSHPLVIYTHGNAEVAYWSIDAFRPWQDKGYAVLLLEYPGYGGAAGRASFDTIRSTVLAGFDAMLKRDDINQDMIVAYGRSIGGGGAGLLASERDVAALILESTFSSMSALVAEKWFPPFLVKDRFDTESIVKGLNVPIFVYHGTRDSIIPVHHGEVLARVARTAKLILADCGHNDCNRPWQAAIEFLGSHGVGPIR